MHKSWRDKVIATFGQAGALADALLSSVAPGLAHRRMQARARFTTALSTYDIARRDRTTADWRAQMQSADQALLADLSVATPRARQIARDSWMGRSAIGAYLRHVVGTGISARSVARDPASNKSRPEGEWLTFNRRLSRLWRRWMRNRSLVDVERKCNLLGVQRWGIREFVTVGECFIVLTVRPNAGGVGLVLQRVEQEQLAQELTRDVGTGNEIRQGVEIDADGAMVALHVYAGGHRLEYRAPLAVERIPAERVLPLWDLERVRQTHGVTRFHAVGVKARHLQFYDDYEIVAKRCEAAICAVRKSGAASAGYVGLAHPTGEGSRDALGNEVTEMGPGMIIDVGQDGDLSLLNPQRPGAQYDPFVRMQVAQVAAGQDMDSAMLLRDFSKANYSGQRQGLLEFWGVTDAMQELIAEQWLRPIWETFVAVAVAEGRVAPPAAWWTDAEARAECLEMDWQPPPKYWIDPARQLAADKLELDIGLSTRSRKLEERGYTFEETVDERAEEEEYARSKGVTFPAPADGVSPFEPRPGSEAGGDYSDRTPPEAQRRRGKAGGNGDRLSRAMIYDALFGEDG